MSDASFDSQYVVDASVWVSAFVPRDAFHAASRNWLREQSVDRVVLACPRLVLPEVAGVVSRRIGTRTAGHEAANDIAGLSIVRLYDLDASVAQDAARLAADLHLRGADAVYVALADRLALPLVTWDTEILTRAASVIDVRTPADA